MGGRTQEYEQRRQKKIGSIQAHKNFDVLILTPEALTGESDTHPYETQTLQGERRWKCLFGNHFPPGRLPGLQGFRVLPFLGARRTLAPTASIFTCLITDHIVGESSTVRKVLDSERFSITTLKDPGSLPCSRFLPMLLKPGIRAHKNNPQKENAHLTNNSRLVSAGTGCKLQARFRPHSLKNTPCSKDPP